MASPLVYQEVEIDTHCADAEAIRQHLSGWTVMHSEAILNDRWEDYSAEAFVAEMSLQGVEWQRVNDDTPGTVWLMLARRADSLQRGGRSLEALEGVEVGKLTTDLSPQE